jgi:hypothetical protein
MRGIATIIPECRGSLPGMCRMCNPNLPKKTRKTLFVFLRLYWQQGGHKMSTDLVVARGQQVVGLLLSTVPLAERMLLYNMLVAACIMLPQRSLLRRR